MSKLTTFRSFRASRVVSSALARSLISLAHLHVHADNSFMGLFDNVADSVSIYEVSPRDGLQNERATVPLRGKLRLIDALVAAGLSRIEITSFVSPKWIPQLADADEVATHVVAPPSVTMSALCPNMRGLLRAESAKIYEVAVFMSASETHNLRNINKPILQTLNEYEELVIAALSKQMRVRAYVSTAWGCPFEGVIAPEKTAQIVRQLLRFGCYQVSLGDTLGCGTPKQTLSLLRLLLGDVPPSSLAMHMHDTRGTALANILVGLECGIRDFDASVGGLGGCPYAPGASGNVATEDLVYMLDGMGIRTGIDLDRLVEAGKVAESIVGRPLPGKVHNAGVRSLRA